eukprot:scaffold80111_cov19-Tisochrysis_lutea.AAC.1
MEEGEGGDMSGAAKQLQLHVYAIMQAVCTTMSHNHVTPAGRAADMVLALKAPEKGECNVAAPAYQDSCGRSKE